MQATGCPARCSCRAAASPSPPLLPRPQTTRVCRPGNRARTSALTPSAARSISTGPGDSDVLDGRPVHLPHLGGGEDRGPVEKRAEAVGDPASPAGAARPADPPSSPRGKDLRNAVHLATSPTDARPPPDTLPRRYRRATATPGGSVTPSAAAALGRPAAQRHPGWAPAPGGPPAPRSPARRRYPCPRVYQPLLWPRTARRGAAPASPERGSRRSPAAVKRRCSRPGCRSRARRKRSTSTRSSPTSARPGGSPRDRLAGSARPRSGPAHRYSTVTVFARLRGWSTFSPLCLAT